MPLPAEVTLGFVLGLYLIVYPFSCPYTDTVSISFLAYDSRLSLTGRPNILKYPVDSIALECITLHCIPLKINADLQYKMALHKLGIPGSGINRLG